METTGLSQSHVGLNLSQFQTDSISDRTQVQQLKILESILGTVTTLTNKKYWYSTLLKTSY